MLVLSRLESERVRIQTKSGEVIWIQVVMAHKGKARLAFEADKSTEILREELVTKSHAVTERGVVGA